MPPSPRIPPDRLVQLLSRHGPSNASALAREAGVSMATLHRLLQALSGQVVSAGRARRTRHALRRPLRGEARDVPAYEIDREGRAHPLGQLTLVQPQGSLMALPPGWPVLEGARDGWWEGLPYPLHDMRPQGYMGRQFARLRHRELSVSEDPQRWTDDEVVVVLSRAGADVSGNWLLGEASHEAWQHGKLRAPEPVGARALPELYATLAEQAVASGVAGSSAAGEFPKFSALRERSGSATPHVLVKFSGADGSPAVRRWSDLLVCEHLALECAATLPGVEAASSRILVHAGRTFLEVERFDRHGLFGRSPLVSLGTLDAALVGEGGSDWVRLAGRLVALGRLAGAELQRVERLWWFGRLIANSDMHAANLSLRPGGEGEMLRLAPAYDMLPMRYAPLPGGEVPPRTFEPPLPLPTQREAWQAACEAALQFWRQAGRDERISEAFRKTCSANARSLLDVAQHA